MKENEQAADDKNLTGPKESETSPPVTTLNNETARHKMIFLSMISGAVAYREKYIQTELDNNKLLWEEMGNSMLADKKKVNTPGKQKKVQQQAAHGHYEFKKKNERFNEVVKKEIDLAWQEFKKPSNTSFDDYINNFGAILEQVLNSKNISELLSLCKAYNGGLMDDAIKVINAAQVEEKQEFFDKVESLEKNNVGAPIDIPEEPVKLSVVKDSDDGPPYSDV